MRFPPILWRERLSGEDGGQSVKSGFSRDRKILAPAKIPDPPFGAALRGGAPSPTPAAVASPSRLSDGDEEGFSIRLDLLPNSPGDIVLRKGKPKEQAEPAGE